MQVGITLIKDTPILFNKHYFCKYQPYSTNCLQVRIYLNFLVIFQITHSHWQVLSMQHFYIFSWHLFTKLIIKAVLLTIITLYNLYLNKAVNPALQTKWVHPLCCVYLHLPILKIRCSCHRVYPRPLFTRG